MSPICMNDKIRVMVYVDHRDPGRRKKKRVPIQDFLGICPVCGDYHDWKDYFIEFIDIPDRVHSYADFEVT